MDVILDTCALLSLAGLSEKKLSKEALDLIASSDEAFVSACSLFEIAFKHRKKGLSLGIFNSPEDFWKKSLEYYRLTVLDVTDTDFLNAVNLPEHHPDPFDRIIISQAKRASSAVITYDSLFDSYDVAVVS